MAIIDNKYVEQDAVSRKVLEECRLTTEVPHSWLQDFTEWVAHKDDPNNPSCKIAIPTRQLPVNSSSPFVGVSDATPIAGGAEYNIRYQEPFILKDAVSFPLTGAGSSLRRIASGGPSGENKYAVDAKRLREGIDYLEIRRQNAGLALRLEMILKRKITYKNGDLNIVVPYEEDIGVLTVPSTTSFMNDLNLAAIAYRKTTDVQLTHVVVGQELAHRIMNNKDVQTYMQHYKYDPEAGSVGFVLRGIQFIVNTNQVDKGGELLDFADDQLVLLTKADPSAGNKRPIQMNRIEHVLNGFDATKPDLSFDIVANDPPVGRLKSFDNFIPSVLRKNLIMEWRANIA